jgi:hypothetical protein
MPSFHNIVACWWGRKTHLCLFLFILFHSFRFISLTLLFYFNSFHFMKTNYFTLLFSSSYSFVECGYYVVVVLPTNCKKWNEKRKKGKKAVGKYKRQAVTFCKRRRKFIKSLQFFFPLHRSWFAFHSTFFCSRPSRNYFITFTNVLVLKRKVCVGISITSS